MNHEELWNSVLSDLRELKHKQFELHDQFEEAKLQPEIFKLEAVLSALDELRLLKEKETRWIPVSERLPTEQDANSKGKIVAWCTSFNGTEVELNWRLIETDGVVTHWRVCIEPPEQEV